MLRSLFLIVSLMPPLAFVTATAQTQTSGQTRHTVMLGGNRAGVQIAASGANGVREITFEFNDRGRGPRITSRIKLNELGVPVSVQTSGNDYLKAAVTESFTLAGGVARWKNNAEGGEKKLTAPAFYLSLHSVPEELALLANALLKAPNRQLPLLPEGQASIQRTSEATVQGSAGSRRVVSYEITGLGFSPETVWLDESGAFFAALSSWSSFVREGWEESVAQLLEQQDTRANARTLATARALTRQPKGPLAIVNANLFDAEAGKSLPGSTVVIEGNRIKAVGKDGAVAIPSGAERIDARGKTLMPGLWDMHACAFNR